MSLDQSRCKLMSETILLNNNKNNLKKNTFMNYNVYLLYIHQTIILKKHIKFNKVL